MASENAEPGRGRLHTAYWLLLTVLFGLPLITPLLNWSAVACTHDGHLHYHRVAALAHAWGNGIFLTRWLPDLAFGYGYPFFVYREAAPLYAVLLPHLAGLPLPAASNLFYAVTILLCGVFMFLWVRDLFDERAALVSAVAYMAAPYVLVDALVRGNAPESLALPLFPFLLWAGRRWVLFGSVRAFLAGVIGLALLSVSHNISTFIFAPTLLVYLLAIVWIKGEREKGRGGAGQITPAPLLPCSPALQRAFLLVLLGLGLAFFYTGGALLEMDQVTLEMSTTTRNNDWRYNFASVGEILSPVAAENPALLNPPLLFRLGWVPLLLAAAGLSGLLWIRGSDGRAREQRLHIWLMALGAAIYLFMALPISRWLWEALPLIDFVQFPWRFVGRAALPVAFLAGVPAYWMARPQTADRRPQTAKEGAGGEWQAAGSDKVGHTTAGRSAGGGRPSAARRLWPAVFPVAAAALLVIEAVPNLYPRLCEEEPFPTILTVHQYERDTGLVGVDPEGSYFPRTVRQRPAGSPLEADYAAGRTPQRFELTALPAAATAREVVYDRFGVSLTVESPTPFIARYLSFAFPGWSARVDGRRVPITPEDPSGLITFAVPAGTHAIAVDWGITPLRAGLVGLSALAAAGTMAVVARQRRLTAQHPPPQRRSAAGHSSLDMRHASPLLAFVALALLGGKLLVDRAETPLRRAGPPPVAQPMSLQGGELRLAGFNLSRESVPAGETFDVDMAWAAVAPPSADYQSEISLVGPDGLAWSQKGTERPRAFEDAPPTRQWSPGQWAWDSREARVLAGAPPGIYDIQMTLFDKATLAPLTLTDAAGVPLGPAAIIGQIEIVNPDQPPTFAPQYSADHGFPSWGLRLLGYNQDRAESAPGDSVLLTFFWECAEPSLCGSVSLSLRDPSGTEAAAWQLPAIRGDFPADAWPAHGRLRGQHAVRLPAGLAGGRYRFYLDDLPLGEIAVTAPQRQFTPPPLAQSLDFTFTTSDGAPVATLAGLAGDSPLPPCSPALLLPCSLPLVWRAEMEIPVSYHVFVHLVDAAGNILAQADGVPGAWARPTTGWLPGEYVIDTHTLNLPEDLPPGPLTLRIGLYDPATGARLRADGGQFVTVEMAPTP